MPAKWFNQELIVWGSLGMPLDPNIKRKLHGVGPTNAFNEPVWRISPRFEACSQLIDALVVM